MAFLVVVAFVCLGYRLVELQVLDHEKYREEAEGATHRIVLRGPRRGDIRDVRGNLLAGSIFVKAVCGNPAVAGPYRVEIARAIAPLLEMGEAEICARLRPRTWTNEHGLWLTNQYVVLKNRVSVETCEQIQATMKRLPLDPQRLTRRQRQAVKEMSIYAVDEPMRVYPNQTLAAHVLGSVGAGEADSPKGKIPELDGLEGIELALDKVLKGVVGWRNTEMTPRQELVAFREQDIQAHSGNNVVLTLDSGVQHILESELAEAKEKHTPISASGLVVRPRTGEILAMATLPTFNPNEATGTNFDARRNRIITDIAEPGSTFKVVVISGALNDGTVSLDDRFDCENGKFYFAGRPLSDHEPYGILSVLEIVAHSSNIGAAKVGIKMGPDRLYDYMRQFGFGTKSGIPLGGERAGLVHPVSDWTKLTISRIPMGHEVAVTPLQMVMAICAVANDGRLMRPMLVDRLEDDDGNVVFRNYPQQVRQVVSERAARLMVTALKAVVSTNGTGKKALLDHYTVAGKTGTAQKLMNGVYRHDHHFSSFIGFLPADDPEICVAIFLDDPKHGYYAGEAAAPVFHDVAERVGQYLGIKADVAPPAPVMPPTPLAAGAPTQSNTVAVNRF
jgi:cell division protein FtsI/penicillin-binding protein 2